MTQVLNVGIVGGSIAGCSAAIQMSRAGHDVTVFERSIGALEGRGGGIATPTATFDALVAEDIIDEDFPHLKATEMPFNGRTSDGDWLGHNAWSLPIDLACFHWGSLWNNLRKRVPDDQYHNGSNVIQATEDDSKKVTLRLYDGSVHTFDLLLFADGYRSFGRSLMFPEVKLNYRGYLLWRGLLPESEMDDSQPLGTRLPRLSYNDMSGHMVIYFVPGHDGSTKEGERLFNWAAYIPISNMELPDFMIDRYGERRIGSLPPGSIRIDEENRLKQLMRENLPGYYAEIVAKTERSYGQLIYTIELPGYAHGRMCVIGDAGTIAQPFTGSGIFKGFNNARDLVAMLKEHDDVDQALDEWSRAQTEASQRILALGEQMEEAFIWKPLDFATADAETTAAWWKNSVTFPENFTYEDVS